MRCSYQPGRPFGTLPSGPQPPWTNPFSTSLPGTTRVFAASRASKVLCCLSAKILAQSNQAPPPGLAPTPFSSLAPQALTDPAQGPLGLVSQTQHTWHFCTLSLLSGRAVQRTHSVRTTSNVASLPKPLGLFLSLVPPSKWQLQRRVHFSLYKRKKKL